jgi:hypothetical protein
MSDSLTAARLREVLDYDPETGVFTWRVQTSKRINIGDRAGYIDARPNKGGYRYISIDDVTYFAAHLVVLWMTGKWPTDDVDHINRIRDDDRWINLRRGSRSENSANARARGGKYSKLKGVSFNHPAGKYQAQIKVNYRQRYLGLFDTAEAAHAAYCAAARKYFGEFAREV